MDAPKDTRQRQPLPALTKKQQREAYYLYARALMEDVDEIRLYEKGGKVKGKAVRLREA